MQQLPVDETIRAALKKTHTRLHRQHELVVEFGVMSLKAADLDLLLTRACEVVAEGMCTRFSKVLQPAEDGEGFVLTHGVGWDASDIGRATVGGDVASPAGYALATYRPVLSNHLGMENRFRTPELLKKYGIERAINVPIRGVLSPFGVLEADSSNGDDFVESDLVFLEGISNVISMAVERISAGVDVPVPDPYSETILNASPYWATYKECFRVFRCIRIGHVRRFRRDAFHTECLPRSHYGRHKSATCANPVAQNDVPSQNNRQAISRCSLLIYLETRRPCRSRAVGRQHRRAFCTEPRQFFVR